MLNCTLKSVPAGFNSGKKKNERKNKLDITFNTAQIPKNSVPKNNNEKCSKNLNRRLKKKGVFDSNITW